MQVERLEEGFDLTGPEIPRRHYETKRRVSLFFDFIQNLERKKASKQAYNSLSVLSLSRLKKYSIFFSIEVLGFF